MAPPRRRRTTNSSRGYDRADRLSELLREIIAETVERIDDDRLQMVTITAVDVDRELEHAKIYYTTLDGDDLADDVVEGFAEIQGHVRKAIGAQAKVRRVPMLTFLPDNVLRSAQRIEEIIATMPRSAADPGDPVPADTSDADTDDTDDTDPATPTPTPTVEPTAPPTPPRSMTRTTPDLHGFAVVDKAAGWTSHDVVAKSRGILRTRKVGHAGTLDPDATGVLVLGVGNATRLLKYCTALGKTYVGEIVFGVETSTLDAAGEVTARHDMRALAPEAVHEASRRFVGAIEQIPPMVSAIKIDGKRLHQLAREGIEVERAPRPVHIGRFVLEELPADADGNPVYRAEVACSSGTYIRTLAADLGAALGGGAHLRALRRTAVGEFTLASAVPIEALSDAHMMTPAEGLAPFGLHAVDAELATLVANGRVLPRDVLGVEGDGPWPVCNADGVLLAVYEAHKDNTTKPSVVLAAGS